MISYKVKYYAYKFLNRRHSGFEKKIVSYLTSLVLYTFRLPDSFKAILKHEIQLGHFKLVLRRISWLMQFSFLKRPLVRDDYFDFSIGLDYESAKDMYQYVKRRQSFYREAFLYELTLAQLSSAVMESQLEPGERVDVKDLKSSQFDQYFQKHFADARVFCEETVGLAASGVKKETVDTEPEAKEKPKSTGVNLMEKHGLRVLRDVIALCDELEIEIFVISGTFLGLHREAGFLAHDYDIDLGVFEAELNSRLLDKLNQLDGFADVSLDYPYFREVDEDVVSYRRTEVPALIKLHHNSGVQVDIFTHFEEGPVYWHGSSLHRWDNLKFDLVEREFLGLKVLAPLQADRYLTENYGDWRTPVRKFNCSTGTPNVVVSDSCKTRCYFLKREYFSNLR